MTLTDRHYLVRYAWLSILAALITIGLKAAAWFITGSVGLLSDAMESLVNLIGAVMALAMLSVAARPADSNHTYGHGKAEYFSSGVEGTLIIVAAISIIISAVQRLFHPQPLEQVGLGLAISVAASAINLAVALLLRGVGRRYSSITLEANAQHLMTDVWTSAGVVAGVVAVVLTGWGQLDPIIALLVGANIIRTGVPIVRASALGLMDTAIPEADMAKVTGVLNCYARDGLEYHAIRTRQAGARRFVSFHVLVPGEWSVDKGHALLEQIEADIRRALPGVTVFTHLESLNDPRSWDDISLDREA
jgi:cation diffusion facilitator family transporter